MLTSALLPPISSHLFLGPPHPTAFQESMVRLGNVKEVNTQARAITAPRCVRFEFEWQDITAMPANKFRPELVSEL